MRKVSHIIIIILMLAFSLSSFGCMDIATNSKSTTTVTVNTTRKTPRLTTMPNLGPAKKVKVTDAYKKKIKTKNLGNVTNRIPKIEIEGIDISYINEEIYDLLKPYSKKHYCNYDYYIGDKYLSLVLETKYDKSEYKGSTGYLTVYNISRADGHKLNTREMINYLGIDSTMFDTVIYFNIDDSFLFSKGPEVEKLKEKLHANSSRAILYVNSEGATRFIINPQKEGDFPQFECGYRASIN